MKRSITFGILVTLVIGLSFALPLYARSQLGSARTAFECDLIAPEPESFDLEKGRVWIGEDGSFKVEVEGITFEGETVGNSTLPVQLLDLWLYNSYALDDLDIMDGEGMVEGYLHDYGVPEGNIIPLVVIDDAFISGCYVPPLP